MKNKELYIEKQIDLAHFNKLLISETPDQLLKEMLNDYNVEEIIEIIESYLKEKKYICFISLFDELKEKLVSFIQIIVFVNKRYIKYINIIEEEYEEILIDLLNLLDYLNKLDTSNKKEYKTILLSYRNISNDKNSLFNLQISYMLDEEVIKYLNGKIDVLDMNNNIKIYISSLLYYLSTIRLCLNSNMFIERANKIMDNLNNQIMKDYIKETSQMTYTDLFLDDLCIDLYGDNRVFSDIETNNIIDINKYRWIKSSFFNII